MNFPYPLAHINSATKYPSIPTYHPIDPKTGRLADEPPSHRWDVSGPVVLTEKVDGTNGRIIILPGGDWLIGSREEILYARGDRIENPNLGIVPALLPLANRIGSLERLFSDERGIVWVYFLEVYGHGVGPAAKNYGRKEDGTGYRLFDVAAVPPEVMEWDREKISSWRQHDGQHFMTEAGLAVLSGEEDIPLTPRIAVVDPAEVPTDLAGMQWFLTEHLPSTLASLEEGAGGKPEGLVLRTDDRSVIAKARFQDYARTLGGKR